MIKNVKENKMKQKAIELAKEIITGKSDIVSIWNDDVRKSLSINFINSGFVVLENNSPKEINIWHDEYCSSYNNYGYAKYFYTETKKRNYKPNWFTKEKTEYIFTDHYKEGYSFELFYEVMLLLRKYQKFVDNKKSKSLLNDFEECLKYENIK